MPTPKPHTKTLAAFAPSKASISNLWWLKPPVPGTRPPHMCSTLWRRLLRRVKERPLQTSIAASFKNCPSPRAGSGHKQPCDDGPKSSIRRSPLPGRQPPCSKDELRFLDGSTESRDVAILFLWPRQAMFSPRLCSVHFAGSCF